MTLGIGEPPEDWTSANVSPILKRDRFKASNYRPVSLTILCCKLQENVNNSNVLIHFEHHKILTDCQHGFTARLLRYRMAGITESAMVAYTHKYAVV